MISRKISRNDLTRSVCFYHSQKGNKCVLLRSAYSWTTFLIHKKSHMRMSSIMVNKLPRVETTYFNSEPDKKTQNRRGFWSVVITFLSSFRNQLTDYWNFIRTISASGSEDWVYTHVSLILVQSTKYQIPNIAPKSSQQYPMTPKEWNIEAYNAK